MTQPIQDQERDEAVAPVPVDAAAPFVPLPHPPAVWRRVDFDIEPETTRPVRIAVSEYRAILDVVSAARAFCSQWDKPVSGFPRRDALGAAVAALDALDALPPQAQPEGPETATEPPTRVQGGPIPGGWLSVEPDPVEVFIPFTGAKRRGLDRMAQRGDSVDAATAGPSDLMASMRASIEHWRAARRTASEVTDVT